MAFGTTLLLGAAALSLSGTGKAQAALGPAARTLMQDSLFPGEGRCTNKVTADESPRRSYIAAKE